MSLNLLLTPKQPANSGHIGKVPHHRYRLVRSQAEMIVRARDELRWSNNQAAQRLGFRSAHDYAETYELLKDNGRRIVERGDWSGVEATIYAKFPGYLELPAFRDMLAEFDDPRARRASP